MLVVPLIRPFAFSTQVAGILLGALLAAPFLLAFALLLCWLVWRETIAQEKQNR